jgi:septum formation protein
MSGFAREAVVLASASASRRAMLSAAGVEFIVDPPNVDEAHLKRGFVASGLDVRQAAEALARAKADDGLSRHPGRIVIGADQMLECDGEWFDKPADRTAAARQLQRLAGRTHRLVSAVVALRDETHDWSHIDTAELTLRPFGADFVEAYLDAAGDRVLSSVGCYQIEGLGIQLFSAIAGDHFTIQGLPLLPLLAYLRNQDVLLR